MAGSAVLPIPLVVAFVCIITDDDEDEDDAAAEGTGNGDNPGLMLDKLVAVLLLGAPPPAAGAASGLPPSVEAPLSCCCRSGGVALTDIPPWSCGATREKGTSEGEEGPFAPLAPPPPGAAALIFAIEAPKAGVKGGDRIPPPPPPISIPKPKFKTV